MMKVFNAYNLKKHFYKGGVVLGMVGLLCIISSSTTVIAGSTVSGELNGFACYGRVSKNQNSASAVTTFSRGNSDILARATVYYRSSGLEYDSIAFASSISGGVNATAYKQISGANVIGGKGEHFVAYGDYSWSPDPTKTGEIPSASIRR